jgi:uncharacterized membrane protein
MQPNSTQMGRSPQSSGQSGGQMSRNRQPGMEWMQNQGTQNRGAQNQGAQSQGGQSCGLGHAENVGSTERIVSAGLGGLLVASGVMRGRLPGLLLTAAGASLLYRGLSGFCAMYQQLGINTNELDDQQSAGQTSGMRAVKGVKIEESFVIDRSAHELYDIWTRWEQLPKLLPHIKKIEVLSEGRTRWTAHAPLGATLTWEAMTIKQEADRMVSWRSVGGDVDTAGSVHFNEIGGGRTEMRVSMQYDPPGGRATAMLAEYLGMGLDARVREDLQQFKQRLESQGGQAVQGAHAASNVTPG